MSTSETKTTRKQPDLARAAESCDAAVHNLLAQRAGLAAVGDTDGVARVDAELAKLGYR